MNSRILAFWGVYKWLSCNLVLVQGIEGMLHGNAVPCKVTARSCYNLYLYLRSPLFLKVFLKMHNFGILFFQTTYEPPCLSI